MDTFLSILQNIKLSDITIQILLGEEVTEELFLTLNESDLIGLKIKIADRKKIKDYVNSKTPKPPLSDTLSDFENYLFNDEIPLQNRDPPPTKENKICFEEVEKIDIEEILLSNKDGKRLIKSLNAKNISEPERCKFVRVLVGTLIDQRGSYCPNILKHNLAKAIVAKYPFLGLKKTDGTIAYEHYFDIQSRKGYIENRFKTHRLTLSPKDKKNKKRGGDESVQLVEERIGTSLKEQHEEKINAMKYMDPTVENKTKIKLALEQTKDVRMEMRKKDEDILDLFPRLIDYKGEMIIYEYSLYWEDGDNLIAKMPSMAKKIKKFAMANKNKLFDHPSLKQDDLMNATLLLLLLLPPPNIIKSKRKDKKEPWESFIYFANENEKLSEIKQNIQPYIIVKDAKYFIAFEEVLIESGDVFLKCLDLLYKTFYVFNMHYDAQLSKFFNFLDVFVYEKKLKAIPSATQLMCQLSNLKDEENSNN